MAQAAVEARPQSTTPRDPGSYERLKQIATGADAAARVRLGAAPDTPPELLYFLASDRTLAVRAAVALNTATPTLADDHLLADPDERVRMVLARKLASLTPCLSAPEQARLSRHAWAGLATLVTDEVARVRATVAALVADLPDGPRALILQLAASTEFAVSDPILRLSPALTEEDLLALLACAPAPHTAASIAQRRDITVAMADAIAASADSDAIRALLANPASAIRETTLDALVAGAADQQDWHEPLVRRPTLSPRAARLLAGYVADRLIAVLAARTDLDPALTQDLHRRLERRLAADAADRQRTMGAPAGLAAQDEPRDSGGRGSGARLAGMIGGPAHRTAQLMDEARRLHDAGAMPEQRVGELIRLGNSDAVCAQIAVAAGVGFDVVQRAGALRSGKAIVSLLWQAGYSMALAGPVQSMLCNMPPGTMLRPGKDGAFPMGEPEMRWQVEFITRPTG